MPETEKELIERCQKVLVRCEDYINSSLYAQAELDEANSNLEYEVRQAIRLIDQHQYRESKKSPDEIAQSLLLALSLMGDHDKLETCQEAAAQLAAQIKQVLDGARNGKTES